MLFLMSPSIPKPQTQNPKSIAPKPSQVLCTFFESQARSSGDVSHLSWQFSALVI